MLPDFNRLKVFYFVFKLQSVALASKELNVTQSAVSQNLLKLEAEIDQKLFVRLHKQLIPTSEGEALFRVTQPFVIGLEGQLEELRQTRSVPKGVLRIGAPVEFGENYVIESYCSFNQIYSDVHLNLELGHPNKLLPMVKTGKLDMAFTDIFIKEQDFSRELAQFDIRPVFDEDLVLVCSGQFFREFLNSKTDLNSLRKAKYIAYQAHSPSIKRWFNYHFNKSAGDFETVLQVESVRGVINAIKKHLGLGIVPSHLIKNEIEAGELTRIVIGEKELVNKISLVRLLDRIPTPAEKRFLEHFSEMIKQLKV